MVENDYNDDDIYMYIPHRVLLQYFKIKRIVYLHPFVFSFYENDCSNDFWIGGEGNKGVSNQGTTERAIWAGENHVTRESKEPTERSKEPTKGGGFGIWRS